MYATTAQMFAYLPQVPQTPENEALFTDLLTRASGMIDEVLIGVDPTVLTPPPPSVEQVTLELAVNMWRQRDRGMWSPSSGVDGEGAWNAADRLTRDLASRRQIEDLEVAFRAGRDEPQAIGSEGEQRDLADDQALRAGGQAPDPQHAVVVLDRQPRPVGAEESIVGIGGAGGQPQNLLVVADRMDRDGVIGVPSHVARQMTVGP